MSTFKVRNDNSFSNTLSKIGSELQFNMEFIANETMLLIPFNLYIHTVQFKYYNNNTDFNAILNNNNILFKTFPLKGATQPNTDNNILSITNIDLNIHLNKYDVIKFTSSSPVDILCFFSKRPNQTNILQTYTIQTKIDTDRIFSSVDTQNRLLLDNIFD